MSNLLVTMLVVLYGGLVLGGGLLWLLGWLRHHDRLAKTGYTIVLIGLCVDFVLLSANWLVDWVGWLDAGM